MRKVSLVFSAILYFVAPISIILSFELSTPVVSKSKDTINPEGANLYTILLFCLPFDWFYAFRYCSLKLLFLFMKAARLIDYKKFEFIDSDIQEPSNGECLWKLSCVNMRNWH